MQNMKRLIISIVSILVFIVAVVCAIQFGHYWWVVLRDPQRPEFVNPVGTFISGPEAGIDNSILTITWAAADEYQINSIYFKKKWGRFPNYGGGDVDVEYDPTNKAYNYTAQFLIDESLILSQGDYVQYLEPGNYTYQVWSNTLDYSKKIVSPVLDLDLSE